MSTSPRTTEHPISPLFTDRWSPRALTGEAIEEATLLSFLEAARWAPSASNIQPWRFVYAHAGTPAFQSIWDGLVPFNQSWANKASALVVVLSQTTSLPPGKTERAPNPWHSFDSGSAWMQLALQASLSGWATHGMGGFVADTLRANLAIPAHVAVEAVVAVGKRGDPAALPDMLRSREGPSARLPLAAIAAQGNYSFAD
jgi:nitroreductase